MKFFLLNLLIVFLSSCSTQLKYYMNNHKFLSPEAKGELLKGDLAISYQQTQKVVVAEAFDYLVFNLPPSTSTSESISRSSSLDIPINIGLSKKIDFVALDSKYGFKYQFLGTPQNEIAEGYKAAAIVTYGYDKQDPTSVTYSSTNNNRIYSTQMEVTSYEMSLIFGKRFSENRLLYMNFFRDNYKYSGTLSSTQFATINATGKSYNQGVILGAEYIRKEGKHVYLGKLEIGVADAKVDNRKSLTVGTYGFDFGWGW